ncbi:MAG: hypothetical protein IKS48_06080 [Eubacterium sp.]|nr:hypothetical protein [Eubacterium sp.]
MNIKQVNTLVNSMASQMEGITGISSNDLRNVVQLGKTVLSTDNYKDKFLSVLADRIGTTILRNLDLELEFPQLLRNSFEWGAIIQKINIQPFTAEAQNAWNVGANDFSPNQFAVTKPTVVQTFFTDATAWEFHVTIPDTMLKTAFTNEASFGAFIDGIMGALTDSMTMALNNLSYAAIGNFVAEKIKNGNAVIDVLSMYNDQVGSSGNQHTTLADAMDDKEFFRYAGMVMRNIIKYLEKPSALYNLGDGSGNAMVRATQRDNLNVFLSSDFMAGYVSYLQSDTFHNELVAMPGYKEYVTLQATGVNIPDITDNTSINIIPASNNSTTNTAIQASGIIGIFVDREAIGIGYDDRFTATDRNNRNRYTNYTSGATLQYYNDLSENGVIICAAGGSLSLDKYTLTFANSSAADQTVTATTNPSGGDVTWASDKETVATVAAGVVSAAGAGTCNITATYTYQGVTYKKVVAVTVGSEAKSRSK